MRLAPPKTLPPKHAHQPPTHPNKKKAVGIGLLTGALFFQLPVTPAGGRSVLGAAYLFVLFMVIGNTPSLVSVLETKDVWLKHRDNYFYSPLVHVSARVCACVCVGVVACVYDGSLPARDARRARSRSLPSLARTRPPTHTLAHTHTHTRARTPQKPTPAPLQKRRCR